MNQEIWNRTEWFRKERFGMFIHWGLYAIPALGEWVMSEKRMTVEEYEKYFEQFDPTDYNPREWARLAKKAGMKYAVLTAKHHDGFCLFDSALTDYKATNTKAGRDLVREFLDAFRAEGLKVGLYFTLIDWHHPDYPKYNDMHHPMRGNEAYKDENINFDRYLEYMHGQVEELVTNYGKLDILWFDFSYDNMCEDTWKAEELIRMVRKHQPDVIIDNRLEGSGEKNGSIVTDHPNIYSGDFASPEMIIPPGGMKDLNGKPIPWELCATMNNHWGYCYYDHTYKTSQTIIRKLVECVSKGGNFILNVGPDAKGRIPKESHWGYCYYDHTYKTSQTIIRKLVECVSKGGNFILNVGPDAKGRIPKESQEILTQVGEWMEQNGESLYECGISEYDKPEWGRYTQKGNTVYAHIYEVYAHIYETPLGALPLYGISPQEVGTITFLSSGAQVQRGEAWNTAMYSDTPFVALGENPVFSYPLPDEIDTVLKIELKK